MRTSRAMESNKIRVSDPEDYQLFIRVLRDNPREAATTRITCRTILTTALTVSENLIMCMYQVAS